MQSHPEVPSSAWLVWIHMTDVLAAFNMAPRLEITREMRNLGWKVDLIGCGPGGKHIVQGVEVLCFPRPKIYLINNVVFHLHVIRYILRNWKQIRVVLFSQMSVPWILPLRLLQISRGQHPIFVVDTRTVPMEPRDKTAFKNKLRGQFMLLMNKYANWLADGQTAITKRMAELLAIPDKKLWGIWSSGVNKDRFSIAAKKRRWPGHNDPVVIIYIGTLNYERNLMALCRAIVESNHRSMRFVLWLYGDGNEKNDLRAFAGQHDEYIKVFDPVPNERIPEVLASAHVGALPFPDEEKYRVSSPIKLFEYMGAGLPILATKIVCHTDVIGDGDYVFWAEGSDTNSLLEALRQTWQARTSLAALGKSALMASGDWTWAASACRLDAALQHGLTLHLKSQMAARR